MTRRSTCISSALRGAAFGAGFAASFCAALLAFSFYAGPTALPAPVSCAPAVGADVPHQAPRAGSAGRDLALTTSDEAGTEAPTTQAKARIGEVGIEPLREGSVVAARAGASSKAGALARGPAATPGGAPASGPPLHVPRRDPPRMPASGDSAPSAGLAPGDLQQMAALLAGMSGTSAGGAGDAAFSPQLLQKLLGGGLGANGGAGVSPELLQKLLGGGGDGNALSPELLQKLLGARGAVPPDLGL
jgi:hypothetical protein